jgi:hypothetical protein
LGQGDTDIFKSRYDRETNEAFRCLDYDDFSGASIRVFFMQVDIKNYFNELVKLKVCKGDIGSPKHK